MKTKKLMLVAGLEIARPLPAELRKVTLIFAGIRA